MFRYVVLGLLHSGTARHGYALMKEYRDRAGVQVSTGNFYRDLQRLVSSGLVRTVDRAPDGDPRRAPYQITESGRDAFRRWFVDLGQLGIANGHEDELSARIAFFGDVDPADARAAALSRATGDPPRGLPVLALMLGRRIRRIAAELAFLDDLRSSYEEWLTTRPPVEPKPAAPDVPMPSLAAGAKKSV